PPGRRAERARRDPRLRRATDRARHPVLRPRRELHRPRGEGPWPLHDPQNVVDVLVGLVADPKDQKIVGADGIAKVLLQKLAPAVAEKLGAKQMQKTQMEQPPPGPDTSGAVKRPMAEGTEVGAGRRETGR